VVDFSLAILRTLTRLLRQVSTNRHDALLVMLIDERAKFGFKFDDVSVEMHGTKPHQRITPAVSATLRN